MQDTESFRYNFEDWAEGRITDKINGDQWYDIPVFMEIKKWISPEDAQKIKEAQELTFDILAKSHFMSLKRIFQKNYEQSPDKRAFIKNEKKLKKKLLKSFKYPFNAYSIVLKGKRETWGINGPHYIKALEIQKQIDEGQQRDYMVITRKDKNGETYRNDVIIAQGLFKFLKFLEDFEYQPEGNKVINILQVTKFLIEKKYITGTKDDIDSLSRTIQHFIQNKEPKGKWTKLDWLKPWKDFYQFCYVVDDNHPKRRNHTGTQQSYAIKVTKFWTKKKKTITAQAARSPLTIFTEESKENIFLSI